MLRRERDEGTLLAAYIETSIRGAALALAVALFLGLTLSLIILIAVYGNVAAASTVAFTVGPASIAAALSPAFILSLDLQIISNMQQKLVILRESIFRELCEHITNLFALLYSVADPNSQVLDLDLKKSLNGRTARELPRVTYRS